MAKKNKTDNLAVPQGERDPNEINEDIHDDNIDDDAESLHMEEMSDFYYSEDEGDPTAKLEAAGIRTRDFAAFPLSTPLPTSDLLPNSSLDKSRSDTPRMKQTNEGKALSGIFAAQTPLQSQKPPEASNQTGSVSTYHSALPQSWLQPASVGQNLPGASYEGRLKTESVSQTSAPARRPTSFHRTDDLPNFFGPRGSQGDAIPYNPARRTLTFFENRQHYYYSPTRSSNHSAEGHDNEVADPMIQGMPEISRPLSNVSFISADSDMDSRRHRSRHSSGDMPPRYPFYREGRGSQTST